MSSGWVIVALPFAKTRTDSLAAAVAAAAGAPASAAGSPTATMAPAVIQRRCTRSVISYPVLSVHPTSNHTTLIGRWLIRGKGAGLPRRAPADDRRHDEDGSRAEHQRAECHGRRTGRRGRYRRRGRTNASRRPDHIAVEGQGTVSGQGAPTVEAAADADGCPRGQRDAGQRDQVPLERRGGSQRGRAGHLPEHVAGTGSVAEHDPRTARGRQRGSDLE